MGNADPNNTKAGKEIRVQDSVRRAIKQLIIQHAIIAMKCMRAIKGRVARPVNQLENHLNRASIPLTVYQPVDWAVKMRIRPPEIETSICDAKYHVSLKSARGGACGGLLLRPAALAFLRLRQLVLSRSKETSPPPTTKCSELGAQQLRPVSRGNRHFTVDCGRQRQSGPRPETGFLRQPALEGLKRSARTDSPRNIGRNNFRRTATSGGGGGVF
ncbi:hypothetical protein F511_17509 [Dorcoceras hygrometricum]|uniref:Uncharacterized protein n=1 Tax=Dorcoceras hygrometricum TaxID=472368 RepID=A0A2Z7ATX8_9LAMI|nr:hypothetical protein F511_17509 [Dorcoceras hygrometricum]